jgi:hypothetical protein
MNSARAENVNEIQFLRGEVAALFSVIYETVDELSRFLERVGHNIPPTSYHFVSDNIRQIIEYASREIPKVRKKAEWLEATTLSSPLLLSTYRGRERVAFFELRNIVRENAEEIRQIASNLISNISSAFHAYIFVYEILEKFRVKTPFVLIESDSFSSERALVRLFREYLSLGPQIQFEDADVETITYSGLEIESPETLFLLAHEAFHIIGRSASSSEGLFEDFCRKYGISMSSNAKIRCNEAFIDAMVSMYLGPAYVIALRNYFEKIYPVSGERHAEMTSRLTLLLEIWQMMKYEFPGTNREQLNRSISQLARLMSPRERAAAASDLDNLTRLLEKGLVQYIKEFFDRYNIRMYPQFLQFWTSEEAAKLDIDGMDEPKIRFCLKRNIPIAIRPTILLTTLMKYKKEFEVKNETVVASMKKWYVKRYYQKALESSTA